jgi:hypothetical protein
VRALRFDSPKLTAPIARKSENERQRTGKNPVMREKPFRGLIRIFFHGIFGPAEQLADKNQSNHKSARTQMAGAEAHAHFAELLARLKPCRCYKTCLG